MPTSRLLPQQGEVRSNTIPKLLLPRDVLRHGELARTPSPPPPRAHLFSAPGPTLSIFRPSQATGSALGPNGVPIIPHSPGRLNKREFQRQFRARWSQASQSWDTPIPLGPRFHSAVAQWTDESGLSQGVPITLPPPQADLYTDASNSGWGAHSGPLTASGLWPHHRLDRHINVLESEAVVLALRSFHPELAGKHVRVCTDNTTVACYINRQGGARSRPLSLKTEELLRWCHSRSISLTATHVPGKFNILADALSRSHSIIQTEWTIAHSCLEPIRKAVSRPT